MDNISVEILSDGLLKDLSTFQTDTLIIAGGEPVSVISNNSEIIQKLTPVIEQTARVASICSGALILAATGVLDNRKATTHWSRYAEFSQKHPSVELDIDALFTRDGKYFCSAGR